MIIYFDESSDQNNTYFLQGALFCPHPKALYRAIKLIKVKYNYYWKKTATPIELHFSTIQGTKDFAVTKDVIDAFIESTAWFRAVGVKYGDIDWNKVGNPTDEQKIKKAKIYTKLTTWLLSQYTHDICNAVLITDEMIRTKKDQFIKRLTDKFCIPGWIHSYEKFSPTFKKIEVVDSRLENYHVIQLCDVLLGAITNELVPPKNEFKIKCREYLKNRLRIESLTELFWKKINYRDREALYPKYNIVWKEVTDLYKKEEEPLGPLFEKSRE